MPQASAIQLPLATVAFAAPPATAFDGAESVFSGLLHQSRGPIATMPHLTASAADRAGSVIGPAETTVSWPLPSRAGGAASASAADGTDASSGTAPTTPPPHGGLPGRPLAAGSAASFTETAGDGLGPLGLQTASGSANAADSRPSARRSDSASAEPGSSASAGEIALAAAMLQAVPDGALAVISTVPGLTAAQAESAAATGFGAAARIKSAGAGGVRAGVLPDAAVVTSDLDKASVMPTLDSAQRAAQGKGGGDGTAAADQAGDLAAPSASAPLRSQAAQTATRHSAASVSQSPVMSAAPPTAVPDQSGGAASTNGASAWAADDSASAGPASAVHPSDANAVLAGSAAVPTSATTPAETVAPSAAVASSPAAQAEPAAQQVSAALLSMGRSADGSQHVTLRLQPAELGQVEIRIDRPVDSPARVDIAVQRPETMTLLLRDQPQLQRALDQAGIPADGRSISLHLTAPGNTLTSSAVASPSGSAANAGPGQDHGGGGGSQRGGQGRPDGAPDQEQDNAPAPFMRWLRAGLDITA